MLAADRPVTLSRDFARALDPVLLARDCGIDPDPVLVPFAGHNQQKGPGQLLPTMGKEYHDGNSGPA
jgi:hypothetical protein